VTNRRGADKANLALASAGAGRQVVGFDGAAVLGVGGRTSWLEERGYIRPVRLKEELVEVRGNAP
jgi:hypothetical protein